MRKYHVKALSLGAFTALFVLAVSTIWWTGETLSEPVGQTAGIFTIKKGSSLREVAFSLKQQGVVNNPILLLWYGEVTGRDRTIQAGVYDISPSLRLKELFDLFEKGSNVRKSILLHEGLTVREVAQRFRKAGMEVDETIFIQPPVGLKSQYRFFDDAPKNASLEGFLFPDKYFFDPSADTTRVAQTLLDNFKVKFEPTWYTDIEKEGHTVYETVIMASLLEKEVRTSKDKKIVAGLLWKRLSVGMPLQLDSTVNYATGKSLPAVTLDDLAVDSLYNTYKYQGLPPGPITNPGKDSLEAAVFPATSDYWYYLSRQDTGETIFSKNYREHLSNKAKYLP